MRFCPNCGSKVSEEERACPRCGEPLRGEADERLKDIYRNLLAEKSAIERSGAQSAPAAAPAPECAEERPAAAEKASPAPVPAAKREKEKPAKKPRKKAPEPAPEDPFERISTGFSAVRMVGPERGKVKPRRHVFLMIFMMLLTLGTLATLYLSFPLDAAQKVRGYDPALWFIHKYKPDFIKLEEGFGALVGGLSGWKKTVGDILPYCSMAAIGMLALSFFSLCFAARYRKAAKGFALTFLSFAFVAIALMAIGYCLIVKPVWKPFPYGAFASMGACLFTILVVRFAYRRPKKKSR